MKQIVLFLLLISPTLVKSQNLALDQYNVKWDSQSKNSSESMPLGGGDIGLNVWVENGDLLFYISRSGSFDENNTLLKAGRVRIHFPKNSLKENFHQILDLNKGNIRISGTDLGLKTDILLWVDVFHPVIHVAINHSKATEMEVSFESWRYEDRLLKGKENNQNSWKWAPQGEVKTYKDEVAFQKKGISFNHQNKSLTVFDAAVSQQGMDSVKDSLFNPINERIFGGVLLGENLIQNGTSKGKYANTTFQATQLKTKQASKHQELIITLYNSQHISAKALNNKVNELALTSLKSSKKDYKNTTDWWVNFWSKSFITISKSENADSWQVGKNYQLFRYMLGCNAYGEYPTKFNGGLFTYDPVFTDSTLTYTPDFRNWGGGTHTAQNQRLVYWPLLKSGDADLMKPQFDFYLNILKNAELRSKVYWNHNGASFTEQIENFGLPNPAEYGWKRPSNFDKGLEYNAWLEYEWDTVLEFCQMILDTKSYQNTNITTYLPLIKSSLTFFDEHYQYLAKQRGAKTLDANGKLVLFPGSAAETYKMAYNSSSTIAGLTSVLKSLLALPDDMLNTKEKNHWQGMLQRIPKISFRSFNGKTTIAPALTWQRINNTESPQLYPIFPWKLYGLEKSGLDTAVNTYLYDTDALKFRDSKGWKQDNIFAARLGLTHDAVKYTFAKLKDANRRFPAFWGPGFDWTPDHNWGGSGMIGLQEMLLQDVDDKILLFPAWPKNIDVHFKLHAPKQTEVEAELKNGKVILLKVSPESRKKDIMINLN
jgi:hypothetical protein